MCLKILFFISCFFLASFFSEQNFAAETDNPAVAEVKMSSNHRDYLKNEDGCFELCARDTYSISVTFDLSQTGLDLNSIGPDTQIGFSFGDYYDIVDAGFLTLGDAQMTHFRQDRGGSATFALQEYNDDDKVVVTEKITFRWNKNKQLIVTVTGTPLDDSGNYPVSDDFSFAPDGDIIGTVNGISLVFGETGSYFVYNYPAYTVEYSGKKDTRTVTRGYFDYDLVNWKIKGQKEQ